MLGIPGHVVTVVTAEPKEGLELLGVLGGLPVLAIPNQAWVCLDSRADHMAKECHFFLLQLIF